MRFTPWQIFIINDCNRPLPDFLSKTDRGLLASISFCPGDNISPKSNILWNIDIVYIQSIASYIAGKVINICWEYNKEESKLLEACDTLFNCRAKMLRLTVSACSYKAFISRYIDFIKDLLETFDEIVLLNEQDNDRLLPSCIQTTHIKRRRPCKYPFSCITVGRSGKLFPCPYIQEKNFGRLSSVNEISQNKDYLLFLSAQLCGFLENYPFCQNCQFWLDGWLGEECNFLQDKDGNRFELLWEGHSCTIKRSKQK